MTFIKIDKSKKQKPHLTINEQIEHLSKKGMIINNRNLLKWYLEKFNYQHFVNGYNDFLFISEDRSIDLYKKDVTDNDLINIYKFDRAISDLILCKVLNVERYFVTQLVHLLCDILKNKYGNKFCLINKLTDDEYKEIFSFWFNDDKNKKRTLNQLKSHVLFKTWESKEKEKLVKKYNNRDEIPLWSLCIYWTFGNMRKIICEALNRNDLSRFIAKINLEFIQNFDQIDFYLKAINKIRNICSHNNVVYNFSMNIPKNIRNIEVTDHKTIEDPKAIDGKENSNFKLYDLVNILDKILPSKDECYKLINRIEEKINKFFNNDFNPKVKDKILEYMHWKQKA